MTERADSSQTFRMGGVAKHAVVYGMGMLLSKAVSFIMLPVYTRYLTPADYGVMGLIEMTLDFVSIIAGAQLALAIFRFYHKADSEDEKKAVVSTALIGLTVSYGLVGLGSFLAADVISALLFPETDHSDLIRIASVALAFQSLLIVPLAYARVKDRSTLFVMANLARLVVGLSLNISLVVFAGMGVKGVFISALVANMVTGLWLSVWVTREVGIRFSRQATADLLRYGIPMIGMQFATFTATFGDRFFLQASAGEEVVGLYHLAYQFGFLLLVIGSEPFKGVWAPRRFEVAEKGDRDTILADAFLYSNIWLIAVAVGLSLFVSDVFRVMTQPDFFPAASLVPLILIAYVFQSWSGIQDIGILVRERTGYLALANWIAAAVALIGYATLIPRYSGFGAALSTVMAFAVRWGLTYYFSQRLWPVSYRWKPVIKLCLLAVGVSLGGILLPELHLVLSISIHTGFFLVFVITVWCGGILTDGEKDKGSDFLRKGKAMVPVKRWAERRWRAFAKRL